MTDDKNKPGDEIEFIPDAPPAGEPPARKPAAPSAAEPKEPDGKAAAAEGSRHLKEKLKKKEAEAKDLRREIDELKETNLRRLADMENLRKRFDRERGEFQQYALSGLLLELLDVNDNFERALQSASTDGEGRTLREGVELIFRMFQSLLAKNGVRPIELKDRAFDPNFHHAMTVEESEEVREPEVVEELQKGYMHHDRLLRPALVRVRVPKKGQ
jgi:molecular chaperone GrpE